MITWIHSTTNARVQARSETSSNTYNYQTSFTASQTFSRRETFTGDGYGGTTIQVSSTFYHYTSSEESASSHDCATDSQGSITASSSSSKSNTYSANVIFSLSGESHHSNTLYDGADFGKFTQWQTSVTTASGSTSASTSVGLTAITTFISYQYQYSFLLTRSYSYTYSANEGSNTTTTSESETTSFESTYGETTTFSGTESRGTASYTLQESFMSTTERWVTVTTNTTVSVSVWTVGSSRELFGNTTLYTSTQVFGSSTVTVSYDTVFTSSTTASTRSTSFTTSGVPTTTVRSISGGTYYPPIEFVIAGLPEYNDWPALAKDTTGNYMRVTEGLDTKDGFFTYHLPRSYVTVETLSLRTSVHSSFTNLTTISYQTTTLASSSQRSIALTVSYSSFTTTVASANPGSLLPYTRTIVSTEPVFGTSATTYSTNSRTLRYVDTMLSYAIVPRTSTVASFTAIGSKTTTWEQTVTYGDITMDTTLYLMDGSPMLVLSETTYSSSRSSISSATISDGAYYLTDGSTETRQSSFGRTMETDYSVGQGFHETTGQVRIWQRSHEQNAAWIAPSPELSTQNAGTNLAGLPTAFRIPVSVSFHADGAAVPIQHDGSTVRTFIATPEGFFSASVASSAHTTVAWNISLASVSVTTMSRVNSTSVASGSTAVVVAPAGSPRAAAYNFLDGWNIPLGGRQKMSQETIILPPGLYLVREFPAGGSMIEQTTSSDRQTSTTVGSSAGLSYREPVPQYYVIGRASPQIYTFSRNYTAQP